MRGTKAFAAGAAIVIAQALGVAQSAGDGAQKRVVTLAGARAIASAAENEAKRLNTTGAIAVVDDGGSLLYLVRIDNTCCQSAVTVRLDAPRR